MPRKPRLYRGSLAEPAVLPMPTDPLAWIGREAELGEWMNRKMDEARSEKMRLLYEHYGIDPAGDPEAGHKLALALACAHVPGFGFAPPGAGKPKRLKDHGKRRTLFARGCDHHGGA
jgi:hypothetical protein